MDLEAKSKKRKLFDIQDVEEDVTEYNKRMTSFKQDAYVQLLIKATMKSDYSFCNHFMNNLENSEVQTSICFNVLLIIIQQSSDAKDALENDHLIQWMVVLFKVCSSHEIYVQHAFLLSEEFLKTSNALCFINLFLSKGTKKYWRANNKITQARFLDIMKREIVCFGDLLEDFVEIGFQITEDSFHELLQTCITRPYRKNLSSQILLTSARKQHPHFKISFETLWKATCDTNVVVVQTICRYCEIINLEQFKLLLFKSFDTDENVIEFLDRLFRMKSTIDLQSYKDVCFDLLTVKSILIGREGVKFICSEIENIVLVESKFNCIAKNMRDIFPDDLTTLILIYSNGSNIEKVQDNQESRIGRLIK